MAARAGGEGRGERRARGQRLGGVVEKYELHLELLVVHVWVDDGRELGNVRLEQHLEELGHVGHRALVLDERVREQVKVVLLLILHDEHNLGITCLSHPQAPALLQGSGGRS